MSISGLQVKILVHKCPKCSYKTQSYSAMQKHYYGKHYKHKKGSKSVSKGKDKKIYVFKPAKFIKK